MNDFLELEERDFDIYMKKINNRIAINSSELTMTILESNGDMNIITEAKETFKEKMSKLLDKVLSAIAKFISQVKIEFTTKLNQLQYNKKLGELKDIMAKKRSNNTNGYVDRLDVAKYKQYYKRFINSYIAEVKTGINKDFSSEAEFDEWKNKMQKKFIDFQYTLTDDERWKLSTAIDDAISITEKDLRTRNGNFDDIQRDGEKALKEIHKAIKSNDVSKSVMNYSEKNVKIHEKKKSFVGFVFTQIGNCIKTVVKFISKHIFLCLTALLIFIVTN